jgi:hypothetical protein
MKRVKEMTKTGTKPIWQHFTADKPVKMKVTRKASKRQHDQPKKMFNNPLMNVFKRTTTSRSTSKALPTVRKISKPNNILTRMFKTLGKRRSTSRVQPVLEVEGQSIEDQFGDAPVYGITTDID